ncbi:MAG: hypothetical protein HPY69_18025 [Armatimonadetes bacterium]|nr:hypothetical protein [Armatimonadota bacterium]
MMALRNGFIALNATALLCACWPALAQGYVRGATARETYYASVAALSDQAEFGPWYYAGPFDNTGGQGFAATYAPEQAVDLQATYEGKGGRQLRWQRGTFRDGDVNSLNIFSDNDSIVVYLYRTIVVPEPRELPVLLGSDDGLQVWLNGEKLLANNTTRACTLGDERLTLSLRAGTNELLLKVTQGGGPAGFAFAVDNGPNTLLTRIAQDFPEEINDLVVELDWVRQALAHKATPGAAVAPEDDAPGAVDGTKDGGTGFHTALEDQPWWQVDLGSAQALSHALLYNRNDAAERIARVVMLLSDDGEHWRQVWQNDGTVFHGASDGKPMRVDLAGQSARYVRLQQPGREFLHLDEVEVYGAADVTTNLALNRPATQSSSSPWSTYTPSPSPTHNPVAENRRLREATAEALDLARRTLAFVPNPSADVGRRLDELAEQVAAASSDSDWRDLCLRVRRLRREIILTHPLLGFGDMLVVKRGPTLYSHMVDQYLGRHAQPGDGLVLLRDWKTRPQAVPLLAGKLPRGAVGHPELSFDARRIVFNYCDTTVEPREARRFFLYEYDLESGQVRQITGVPGVDPLQGWEGRQTVLIEDFDPCYLPDGGIAFVSTRNQAFGRCHGGRYTPSYVLYRCDADGRNIRRLSFGEANEWNPSVLPDGRILYTRWDYINRHDTFLQSLWTTRPDGTATAHYYGNSTRNPCMTAQARAIPGTDLVACLAMAHHSYSAGSIIAIDRREGEDELVGVERITPEVAFPETEMWPVGSYTDPYPLSEDLYLAAFDPDPLASQGKGARANGYGIYLVDSLGGRELLYRDPTTCCFAPIPVQPRPLPPAIPSALAPGREDGTFVIQNVYECVEPLEPGSIKSLRVVRLQEQPTAAAPERGAVSQEIVKSVVGTVPVKADGSVAFTAPAETPLLFQLLDEHGMSVFGMRSQVYLQKGETMSCTGCHEPRGTPPPPGRYLGAVRPAALTPPPGPDYSGGLSYARTVQPVLDRYCIRCHGLGHNALSLLGTPDGDYSQSYNALVSRPGLVKLAHRNEQTDISKPGDYGARAGKLAGFLLGTHGEEARLDPESFVRIAEWLDLNGQYYGDYSFDRRERRQPSAEGVAALRAHIAEDCNSCHPGMSEQPLAALANTADPEQSRVLLAPLAETDGGWGQCAEAWASKAAAAYGRMRELVLQAVGTP